MLWLSNVRPSRPSSLPWPSSRHQYAIAWHDTNELRFARLDAAGLVWRGTTGGVNGGDIPVNLAPTSFSGAAIAWTGDRYQLAFKQFREEQVLSLHDLGAGAVRCGCSVNADGDPASDWSDCDDLAASVYPHAPPLCDGLNNDCTDPAWPSIAASNETDDDVDGFSECAGDCDDLLANVFPGAPQICDGLANDCADPGWRSLQGINESGDCLIDLNLDGTGSLHWQSATASGSANRVNGQPCP
ncbi:MAG: putative metal-binding motif-containing protein [Acidobacteriota bacterium]